MNIVPFDLEHYEECWLMGLEFLETTQYKNQVPNKASVYSTFNQCRASGLSFVAVDEYENPIGMILAVKDALWINHALTRSQEVMWWVDKDYRNTTAGMRLIKAYEAACKEQGLTYTGMSLLSTSPEQLSDWLDRKGYIKVETSFIKESM
jgi:hypothetical protein